MHIGSLQNVIFVYGASKMHFFNRWPLKCNFFVPGGLENVNVVSGVSKMPFLNNGTLKMPSLYNGVSKMSFSKMSFSCLGGRGSRKYPFLYRGSPKYYFVALVGFENAIMLHRHV